MPLRTAVLAALVVAGLLLLVAPAWAYDGWEHGTATSKSACAQGCHAETAPTNVACTRCHTGFAARAAQKCWDCHSPVQKTAGWQAAAGCTSTCHVSTRTSGRPSYTTSYAHTPTVHLGATGHSKTCVTCHGVSTGSAAPGRSPHHDVVDSRAPTCAGCHNGAIASAPGGHEPNGVVCSSCHSGMDRPTGDCAGCHVGKPGTSAPQIAFSNDVACGDAACHGRVADHAGAPIGSAQCTTCHAGHYQSLGSCGACHPQPQTFHHGAARARPLSACAGCHDGGAATARTSHGTVACSACHRGMAAASAPAVCNGCHLPGKFGSATCAACHSPAGLTGREQVHAAMPKAGLTCSNCHTAHNADLGSCASCHGLVPEAHHGVAGVAAGTLTLLAEPQNVSPGEGAEVVGRLTDAAGAPLPGAEVLLQERRLGAGAFADAATLVTGADGSFSRPVQPVTGTAYRAVYRGAWSAVSASVRRPAIAEATLQVTQTLTLRARRATARVGARIALTGVAAPAEQALGAAGLAVGLRVERRAGSRWVQTASTKATPGLDGSYSWTWRPKRPGAYRITASLAPTESLQAASAKAGVKVR